MTFLNVNTNLATVVQGVILIGVVMFGSLIQMRRSRAMSSVTHASDGAVRWLSADGAGAVCSATGRSSRCSACWSSWSC